MNPKTKNVLIWSAIAVGVAGVSFLIIKLLNKKPRKSSFQKKIIDIANKEWADWDKGKAKEDDPKMLSRLTTYWENVGWKPSQWTTTGTAWSAAFISYVMRKGGAGSKFKYDASHSDYIRDAVKNRKENNNNPFKAYRLNEKSPEEGDLVCYSRMSQTDLYDKTSSYKSHCDIVVKKTADTIDVIGGNVNHTVGKKTVQLNSDGTVKAGSAGKKWFTVIKTK